MGKSAESLIIGVLVIVFIIIEILPVLAIIAGICLLIWLIYYICKKVESSKKGSTPKEQNIDEVVDYESYSYNNYNNDSSVDNDPEACIEATVYEESEIERNINYVVPPIGVYKKSVATLSLPLEKEVNSKKIDESELETESVSTTEALRSIEEVDVTEDSKLNDFDSKCNESFIRLMEIITALASHIEKQATNEDYSVTIEPVSDVEDLSLGKGTKDNQNYAEKEDDKLDNTDDDKLVIDIELVSDDFKPYVESKQLQSLVDDKFTGIDEVDCSSVDTLDLIWSILEVVERDDEGNIIPKEVGTVDKKVNEFASSASFNNETCRKSQEHTKLVDSLDIELHEPQRKSSTGDELIIDVSDNDDYSIPEYEKHAFSDRHFSEDNKIDFLKDRDWKIVHRDVEIACVESLFPDWGHFYIYNKYAINEARSEKIIKAYLRLRDAFFAGKYYKIEEGESNYVFVLMFDLLGSYDHHRNFTRLENQFFVLKHMSSKVWYYALNNLINIVHERSVEISKSTTDKLTAKQLFEEYPDSHLWTYVDHCKYVYDIQEKQLGYIRPLNDLRWYASSVDFFEYNKILLPLYIDVITECVDTYYGGERTKFEKSFLSKAVLDGYNKKEFYYANIYRICSEALLAYWGYPSLNAFPHNRQNKDVLYKSRLISEIKEILEIKVQSFNSVPKEVQSVLVRRYYRSLWRQKYSTILEEYKKDKDFNVFISSVSKLSIQNKSNTSIKHLYYEVMRTIYTSHRAIALFYYVKYIDMNLKEVNGYEKHLPKYIAKKVFSSVEQQEKYDEILVNFKVNRDLQLTKDAIEALYQPKRKKLEINKAVVLKAEQEHSEMVDMYNSVIDEEFADDDIVHDINDVIAEEPPLIEDKSESSSQKFSDVQIELIKLMVENEFKISESQLNEFVLKHNCFGTQLLDDINNIAFKLLDDTLLEFDDGFWEMDEEYYDMVVNYK